MFTIAEVIRLLTRIFAKANKRFPKGLEGVDIRLKAKKIYDVGKANNYEGAISENQLKQFLAWEQQAPITKEVSKDFIKVPGKKGEVVDITGKKIDTSKPILGGKNVPETEEQILQRLNRQNKESVERLKNKKLEDPEDLAYGGVAGMLGERTGYKDGDDVFIGPKRKKKTKKELEEEKKLREKIEAYIESQEIILPEDPLKKYQPTDYSLYGGFMDNIKGEQTGNIINDFNNSIINPKDARVGISRFNPKTDSSFVAGVGPSGFNVGFKKKFAGGGRTGSGLNYLLGEDDQNVRMPFKDGTKFDPKRRTILKGIGALATLPVIGKFFKWAKPLAKSSKVLTSVPIKDISGMPVWFKPLVNKVIKQGDDVTKKFADADRQIVHTTKLPNSQTDVIVTQDLTSGNVSVDIGMGKHGFAEGHLGQPVRLEYKASEVIEPTIKKGKSTKGTKTKEEFWVEEAEFTGGHPENVKFEETISEKFGAHGSNFDEVEKFATGIVKTTDQLASGGRVPMVFGGRTIGVLKNLLSKMKKSHGIGRGEKSLKSDIFSKNIMSAEDKLKLLQIETKYADSVLESLKLDRQLFKQLETNKEMKDQGLDFLMKHFVDTQTPHMKNYKSLADIDNAILELETLVKNKTMKEGRKLHATGGRVPLAGGKLVLEGLEALMKKFFPGTTKIGQTSKTMAPKTELKRAIAAFQEREKASKLKIWEDKTKVRAAVDDIFPTGDYKYDAEMAAEALVENNPKAFGGKLIDDIDDATRSDIYGSVLRVITNDMAKMREMRKLSKPTKTLAGIEKTGTVNISDPNVADEFSRFMKESDPKGFKDLEQKIQIESFNPKDKKGHATGGLAGMLGE